MKIIEALESEDLIMIKDAVNLLRKGYLINDNFYDIINNVPSGEEIPQRDNSGELDVATNLLNDLIEQVKLDERIRIFLCDGDEFTAHDGYEEIRKSVNKEEYDESKILIWKPFENKEYSWILEHIDY